MYDYKKVFITFKVKVMGLCPTPHKLFEKSFVQNFIKSRFARFWGLY